MNQDEPVQQRISPKVLSANEQRLLNEMEVQYQFNKTMERYANEPPLQRTTKTLLICARRRKLQTTTMAMLACHLQALIARECPEIFNLARLI